MEQQARRTEKHCFNCGDKNHISADCPMKSKGRKCFKCNEFGHVASACPQKKVSPKDSTKTVCNVTSADGGKPHTTVKIKASKLRALFDTGSDLTLIRVHDYAKIGAPPLTVKSLKFKGVGSKNMTLGGFSTEITVCEEHFQLTIHVVLDELIETELILGRDFFKMIEYYSTGGVITDIKKLPEISEKNSDDNKVPSVYKVDIFEEESKLDLTHIANPEHREKVAQILNNYKAEKVQDVGVKMRIILKDDEPVSQRARRLSAAEKDEANTIIKGWLEEGIIRPSESEYASSIVLAQKKNGSTRLCVDYRLLDKKIVRNRYPLPLIEDQLDSLQGSRVFSTLDLANGFLHVDLEEGSRKYTSFVVPDGQYEFLKVPFGLCNSPSVFQRYVNAIFRDLIARKIVLTYMDDLIVHSLDNETGIENLRIVLDEASRFGLKINWSKCRFLQTKIEYLGHVIEGGSISPSDEKLRQLQILKHPRVSRKFKVFWV